PTSCSAPGGRPPTRGDRARATPALERLRARRPRAESGSNAYRAKPFAIMEKELAAVVAVTQKDVAAAEKNIKEATEIELTLDPPSGPPAPVKPSVGPHGILLPPHGGPQ